jgi:non-ribosomal peptide synthetase component F
MLLLAAFATTLSTAVGQPAVSLGMPLRGRIIPELEHIMGFFVGLAPVMLEAKKELRFLDFAHAVKQEVVSVLAHQDLPFEQVIEQASPEQQRAGVYQAAFTFQDTHERQSQWGPLMHEMIPLLQKGTTDNLGMWLLDRPSGLEGALVYNSAIYSKETARALRQTFLDTLAAVAGHPNATLGDLSSRWARTTLAQKAPAPSAPAQLLLPEQARLAQIWASVLGLDVNDIRPRDNFFDLGGDSLLVMRVIQQAEQAFGFRVQPRRYVFESLAQLVSAEAAAADDRQAATPAATADAVRPGLLRRVLSGWTRKN